MHCKITTNCISGKIKLLTISWHLSKQTKLQKKKSIICPHISCSNVERKWKQKKFLLILTISFSYLIFCLDIFWKKKQLKMKLLYKSLACLVLFNVLFSVLAVWWHWMWISHIFPLHDDWWWDFLLKFKL